MRFIGGSTEEEMRASRSSGIASPGLRFLELSKFRLFVQISAVSKP